MTSSINNTTSVRAQFESLAKSATLDVFLPRSSDFNATALLGKSIETLRQSPSRRNLFLDERARVVLVLQTAIARDEIRDFLPGLQLTLAAHATDAVPQGVGPNAASASGKHDLTSMVCNADQDVEITASENDTYVVWMLDVHLTRPKARLQRPAIYFTANLTLRAGNANTVRRGSSAYLQAFEPLPANVLAPLQFDPALRDSNIYLPETRVTKVAPAARTDDIVKPIRAASKRALPTVPALFTKIRYSSLPDAVFVSVHIEIAQITTHTVQVDDVKIDSSSFVLAKVNATAWPKQAQAGDEIIAVFRAAPRAGAGATKGTISISISAVAHQDQGSRIPLDITWQAHIDLPSTITKPTYKWSRPLSSSSLQQARLSTQTASRPNSSNGPQHPLSDDPGVVLTISGPPTVQINEPFSLKVQCINHSPRSRRFTLVIVPSKKSRQQQHPPPPPPAPPLPPTTVKSANALSQILDAPYLESQKPADVLDLNPDVRIGPLPSSACYETQLRFRATVLGVLELGVLRLVDLETRQTVDVRELPDIIALKKGLAA